MSRPKSVAIMTALVHAFLLVMPALGQERAEGQISEEDRCPARGDEWACFEVCSLPENPSEQPEPEFLARLQAISATGHHIDSVLGPNLLERWHRLVVGDIPEHSRAWVLNGRYVGPCSGLQAVFYSKAVEDRNRDDAVELYELRYSTETAARRAEALLATSFGWNYHPTSVRRWGCSVIVLEGRHRNPLELARVAAHFGAPPARPSRRKRVAGVCAPDSQVKPLDAGAVAAIVAGFSPTGRVAWFERPSPQAHWSFRVTDLMNDRLLERRDVGAAKDLRALCLRHARRLDEVLNEYQIDGYSTPALEPPSPKQDATAVEVRSGNGGFALWLRGRAGAKRVAVLPTSDTAPKVLGILRSPFEPRVAIPVVQQTAAGPVLRMFGARLDKGWSQ